MRFSDLFAGATSRTEVVVTFLALLELIRLHVIQCSQGEHFGEIDIVRAPEPETPEVVAANTAATTVAEEYTAAVTAETPTAQPGPAPESPGEP